MEQRRARTWGLIEAGESVDKKKRQNKKKQQHENLKHSTASTWPEGCDFHGPEELIKGLAFFQKC